MKIQKILKLSTYLLAFYLPLSLANTMPSTSHLTSQVQEKLAADKSLSGTHIKVTTSGRVVYLSGNLDSQTEADAATEAAQSVNGVKDVDTSKLTVKKSNQLTKDSLITAKIKGLFIQHKLFTHHDISVTGIKVETNNGIVSLSGKALNQTEINNAKTLAKSVKGVKKVKSSVILDKKDQEKKKENKKKNPPKMEKNNS